LQIVAKARGTYWKIAATTGMSVNHWQPGSLLADVDSATGEIRRCVTGKGPDEVTVEVHPDSGKQVQGYHVPFWQEAVERVLSSFILTLAVNNLARLPRLLAA
jgi:hypothetical protein